jgi:hypothetical protein
MTAVWSPEHVRILRELWESHSAAEIARTLNRTKNSVLGKAWRLGLPEIPFAECWRRQAAGYRRYRAGGVA